LKERGLYDEALIVFTSDHGEEFKEHGRWRHGENLHAETLNVPLVIRFPGQATGMRVDSAVQHIDLMPTILGYLGLTIPEAVQGRSLIGRAVIEGEIYSHLFLSGFPLYHSVVDGEWKLIRRIDEDGEQTYQLYNWVEDATETRDLAAEQPDRTASLVRALEAKLAADSEGEAAAEIPLTEELQEELEALGYLQ
jgi:arylsulfatase A-like enzyme